MITRPNANHMFFIKRFLYKTLGLRGYLKLISQIFFLSYKKGWLKNKREYYCHYYIKNLIQKNDVIIDIGANLGYYSQLFAKLTGKDGKVYAVEPVELFRNILSENLSRISNVEVLPYALGQNSGEQISMGLPASNKYLSHGRTHVVSKNEKNEFERQFKAEMRNPNDLFKDLKKIDYIKCDIEGYEIVVIPEMLPLLKEHKPTLQIETDGSNRKKIIDILVPLGYKIFYIDADGAKHYNIDNPPEFSGDLIFSLNDLENSTKGDI